MRMELRNRMQLVGLSVHASVGLWLTHIIELLGLLFRKKKCLSGLVSIKATQPVSSLPLS